MLFSLVIPTFNRAHLLPDLLTSLEHMRIPDGIQWEIAVVDNNSTDSTKEAAQQFIQKASLPLRYIFEPMQGSSFARNRGVTETQGSILAFLDDDETVDRSWLVALHDAYTKFQCSGVGGRVIAKWIFPCPDWYTLEGPYRIVGPTSEHDLGSEYREYSTRTLLPVTANFSVKRKCFLKHGYFRTDMGPVGDNYVMGEDAEFCLRLIKGGERLIYSPQAITYNVVHKDRVTKKYCRQYHFRFGRIQAQRYEAGEGVRTYAHVPRYLFREYMETLLLWTVFSLSGKSRKSFFHRLKLNRLGGQILEHFLQGRHKRHGR
jgi:glycosyltransferase involved in cell wall biosynthesis